MIGHTEEAYEEARAAKLKIATLRTDCGSTDTARDQ